MRNTVFALAALAAAALPATAAFADAGLSPDQRPLEIEFSQKATYGYSGVSAASDTDISPDKRDLGEGNVRPNFSHETQSNYGGDAGPAFDISPDQRPLGL